MNRNICKVYTHGVVGTKQAATLSAILRGVRAPLCCYGDVSHTQKNRERAPSDMCRQTCLKRVFQTI